MTLLERAKKDNAKIMIKKAGIDFIKNNRDAEVSDEYIMDDEKIYYLLGTECFKKERNRDTNTMQEEEIGDGVLVITDKKITFVDKKMFKVHTNIIWYDEIAKLDFRKGFILPDSKLIIASSSDKIIENRNDYLNSYSFRQNNNLFKNPLDTQNNFAKGILDVLSGDGIFNKRTYYNFFEFRKISKKIIEEIVEFIKGIIIQHGNVGMDHLKIKKYQY